MSRWLFAAAVLLAVGVASPVFAQGAHLGRWKTNMAKSKFDPAPAGPLAQSITRTYEMFGDGLKATFETVSADGKRTTSTYSAHFDGKDYPLVGSTVFDSVALKRIDASTFESTLKKGGRVVSTGRNVVSPDGKMMTFPSKGTNTQGQPTSTVQVLEKQ
jgi:hypothetical protein